MPRKNNLFRSYIVEGYSSRQLSNQIGKKEYRIRKDIQNRLDNNLISAIDIYYDGASHIMIDGYLLPGGQMLLVYYEYIQEKVLWFSIGDGERKEHIEKDLKILKDSFGYSGIKSCTIDGSMSIFSAVRNIYPEMTIQRCLVHIQRQVRSYISKNPKSDAGKQLRHITRYAILSDSFLFPVVFQIWKQTYLLFLSEKSITQKGGRTYTHTKIRKAMRHIENALPYMFQSEKHRDMSIAFSSNKLEGLFGVLTNECVNEHKGIREDRLSSLIALWLYFRNEK